jgi:prepilin-type N-terminal cleavage/methylation domain-containing protein
MFRLVSKRHFGFTLAELLIALAILGEIATFTIPKILTSQQSAASRAKAKEAAGMIAETYQLYKMNNTVTSSTTPLAIVQYMNYVRLETNSQIDFMPGNSSINCDSGSPCVVLHNGGLLYAQNWVSFGGTNATNAVEFVFDPDGVYSGTTADGPSKSVQFILYYNGALTTRAQVRPNTCDSFTCPFPAAPTIDPSWFSW